MDCELRFRLVLITIFCFILYTIVRCDSVINNKVNFDIRNVSKCCEQGYALNIKCDLSNNSLVNPYKPSNGQGVTIHKLKCEKGSIYLDPDANVDDKFTLLSNSTLQLENPFKLLTPDEYCMELIVEEDKILPMICIDQEEYDNNEAVEIYSVGMLLSLPFLLATFLVYVSIRELRTLHGKFLSSHIFALFFSYFNLGVLQIFHDPITQYSETLCVSLGYSVQYFFLATFFWLNVMCIDIYWTFSSVRLRGGRHGGGDARKLLLYSLYAWGMPLLILLITVGIDFSDVPNSSPYKPKVGQKKCFFEDRESAFTYFYGPMAIILCVNMVLFGITAYRIWRTSKETASLNKGDSRRHSNKQENERFKLYMKLFLVMGINWVAELISFILGTQVPHYLWYVTDSTNTLQGVFIFIIFVWKRRVMLSIKATLCSSFKSSSSLSSSRRTVITKL